MPAKTVSLQIMVTVNAGPVKLRLRRLKKTIFSKTIKVLMQKFYRIPLKCLKQPMLIFKSSLKKTKII